MSNEICKQAKKIEEMEIITKTLLRDISQISHDIKGIRVGLMGDKDGLQKGAIPELRETMDKLDTRVLSLEASRFSEPERLSLLAMANLFKGWKAVGLIIFLSWPIISFLINIIRQ